MFEKDKKDNDAEYNTWAVSPTNADRIRIAWLEAEISKAREKIAKAEAIAAPSIIAVSAEAMIADRKLQSVVAETAQAMGVDLTTAVYDVDKQHFQRRPDGPQRASQ